MILSGVVTGVALAGLRVLFPSGSQIFLTGLRVCLLRRVRLVRVVGVRILFR
jgi:hypothetical protein